MSRMQVTLNVSQSVLTKIVNTMIGPDCKLVEMIPTKGTGVRTHLHVSPITTAKTGSKKSPARRPRNFVSRPIVWNVLDKMVDAPKKVFTLDEIDAEIKANHGVTRAPVFINNILKKESLHRKMIKAVRENGALVGYQYTGATPKYDRPEIASANGHAR